MLDTRRSHFNIILSHFQFYGRSLRADFLVHLVDDIGSNSALQTILIFVITFLQPKLCPRKNIGSQIIWTNANQAPATDIIVEGNKATLELFLDKVVVVENFFKVLLRIVIELS